MPRYYEGGEGEEKEEEGRGVRHWRLFLAVVFLYYFVSCGVERIYQPMAFTFGLCGPLKLAPR